MTWTRVMAVLCAAAALSLGAWGPSPAGAAATKIVTTLDDHDDGTCDATDCTLREAVKYAPAGYTVIFHVDGIITLDSGLGEITINKILTIDGNNTEISDINTVVSGNNASRVFKITAGTVIIKDMRIDRGRSLTSEGGGGIFNAGSLTLQNVYIYDCLAYGVGGAVCSGNDLEIEGCIFRENASLDTVDGGGGLYVDDAADGTATVTISNTTFDSNTTQGGGGAIRGYNVDLQVTGCRFDSNHAHTYEFFSDGGGAVQIDNGTATITDTAFLSNDTPHDGGAIVAGNVNPLSIIGSTFYDNMCEGYGGAISLEAGELSIINSTFHHNRAYRSGGALNAAPAPGTPALISFCTITDNIADASCGYSGGNCDVGNGGGIYAAQNHVRLKGVILAGNNDLSSVEVQPDCASNTGVFQTAGYNLIGSNYGCASVFDAGSPNANMDYVGSTVVHLDPMLAALGENGGPTQTMVPLPGSLAINHGPPDSSDAGGNPVTTDQTGRSRDIGGRPEIGAYENAAGSPLGLLLRAN